MPKVKGDAQSGRPTDPRPRQPTPRSASLENIYSTQKEPSQNGSFGPGLPGGNRTTTPRLLEDPSQLAGHAQQLELCLLALIVGVQEGHPLVTLFEARLFNLAEIQAALLKLHLEYA